jgi:hypothetical protein
VFQVSFFTVIRDMELLQDDNDIDIFLAVTR